VFNGVFFLSILPLSFLPFSRFWACHVWGHFRLVFSALFFKACAINTTVSSNSCSLFIVVILSS
jgi:hypothetical protein